MGSSKPPQWTESERARLDELIEEREFEQRLRAKRAKTWESAKAWAQWITVILAAGGVIWEKFSQAMDFVRAHIR